MPAGVLKLVRAARRGLPRKRPTMGRYASVHTRRPAKTNGVKSWRHKTSNVYSPPTAVRQRGMNPFPQQYLAKLHYAHGTGIAPATAHLAGKITYRLNSIFDPDKSGTGHQPYQFDQLSGIYARSQVYGCKIDLEWTNPQGDGLYVGYNLINPTNGGGVHGKTLDVISELPNVHCQPINNSGSQVKRMSLYVPLHKLNGITKAQFMANKGVYSEATVGPAISTVNDLEIWVIDSTGGFTQVNFKLNLTYYVLMYDYLAQAQS